MIAVIETEKKAAVLTFVAKTILRIERTNKIFPVMDQFIKIEKRKNCYRIYYCIKNFYNNTILWTGSIILMTMLLVFGVTVWLLLPAFLISLKYFETRYFALAVMKNALKKGGYDGYVKEITYELLLEEQLRGSK